MDYYCSDSCEGFTSKRGGNFVVSMFEPNTQEKQDSTQHQSFIEKLLGDGYLINEQLPNEQQIASA